MWPFRTRSIFTSRWIALAFAGYVVWQAVDYAGDQPSAEGGNAVMTDATGEPVTADDAKQIEEIVNGL